MKVKYKDQVIEVCESATFEVVGGDLVITPKEQEFKDGDILVLEDGSCPFIFKKIKDGYAQYIVGLSVDGELLFSTGRPWTSDKIRKAIDKEFKPLFDALENDGKKWNPDTKQIEDILKVGDLAIFWDKNKKGAIVSEILETNESGIPYRSTCSWFNNAIKCTSLEQYINFKK